MFLKQCWVYRSGQFLLYLRDVLCIEWSAYGKWDGFSWIRVLQRVEFFQAGPRRNRKHTFGQKVSRISGTGDGNPVSVTRGGRVLLLKIVWMNFLSEQNCLVLLLLDSIFRFTVYLNLVMACTISHWSTRICMCIRFFSQL